MELMVNDWLQAADHEVEMRRWREESRGEWKHITVHHEVKNLSPEMLKWYFVNFDAESYKMWHPAHIGLQWERKIPGPGAIHIAWEKINGKLAAYRIQFHDGTKSFIKPKSLQGAMTMNALDTEGKPLISILVESKPTDFGMSMDGTFSFPVKAPEDFVEAHRRHCEEEIPGMTNVAVPYLIRKTFGYMAGPEVLMEYPFVVPPEAE